MAESSPLQSDDDQQLLQAALEHPFEPAEVPLTSPPPPIPPSLPVAPASPTPPAPSETPPSEEGTWQTTYASQVSEWRAQSASTRAKAEVARAKWEAIRADEDAERRSLGQSPESSDGLGDHITDSVVTADQIVSRSLSGSVVSLVSAERESHEHPEESAEHAVQGKTEGSPSQRWEHLSSSPASSYPSMSFPEASAPQSPSQQHTTLVPTSVPAPTEPRPQGDHNTANVSPSTLPSIMDKRVAPRTRLSLVISSLAINLILPFINGVMLGFGEIFAKEVVIGWFGWKPRYGSTAAGLGLRR